MRVFVSLLVLVGLLIVTGAPVEALAVGTRGEVEVKAQVRHESDRPKPSEAPKDRRDQDSKPETKPEREEGHPESTNAPQNRDERPEPKPESRPDRGHEELKWDWHRVEKRFGEYARRLTNLMAKIQARIEALKSAGKDVATVQAKLDEAKTKLQASIQLGAEAVVAFQNLGPDPSDEEVLQAKALAQQARSMFKEVLAILKEVRSMIKAMA